MDTNHYETTETNFNSTLLDDEPLFSPHKVNTLSIIDLENHDNNKNHNNNHKDNVNDSNNSINNYDNQRQPVSSTSFLN